MHTDSYLTQATVDYYMATTRELVSQLNPHEPDEWRSCNRLCGQIWDEVVASRHSEESAHYHTENSSVPRKILKFANAPGKYVWEMRLIDALSGETDVSMLRIKYEKTFGEPFCTFTDDRRVEIVLDVLEYAWRRSQARLFAQCLSAVGQPSASDHTRIAERTPAEVVERRGHDGEPGNANGERLSDALLELGRAELRLHELLDSLRALDPKIARMAGRYAYGC